MEKVFFHSIYLYFLLNSTLGYIRFAGSLKALGNRSLSGKGKNVNRFSKSVYGRGGMIGGLDRQVSVELNGRCSFFEKSIYLFNELDTRSVWRDILSTGCTRSCDTDVVVNTLLDLCCCWFVLLMKSWSRLAVLAWMSSCGLFSTDLTRPLSFFYPNIRG